MRLYTHKDRIRVVIITSGYRIEGDFHVLAGSRLTDVLNSKAKDFFAITDAKVYQVGTDVVLYTPSYVAVNRDSIACILPIDEG
ncbi:MAG: hypothetical protein Q7W30_06980 [Coriobacteriia bacterium]|nr:hypothetical protein [Coriobacteriia bacterium]